MVLFHCCYGEDMGNLNFLQLFACFTNICSFVHICMLHCLFLYKIVMGVPEFNLELRCLRHTSECLSLNPACS